ncbi:hypothetical protein R1sor_017273 [Riccia sorocarpa]|uniref:Uncharacterized protein n=1 Tax=Riccia sorocarpa TaxID=122646 RepID=A0ABD3IAC3_9MARC
MQAEARSLLLGAGSYGPKLLNLPGRKRESTRRESVLSRSVEFPGGEKRQCSILPPETLNGATMAGEYEVLGSGLDPEETQRLLTQLQENNSLIEELLVKSSQAEELQGTVRSPRARSNDPTQSTKVPTVATRPQAHLGTQLPPTGGARASSQGAVAPGSHALPRPGEVTATSAHIGAHPVTQQGGSPRTHSASGAPATNPGLKSFSYASVASGATSAPASTAKDPELQKQANATNAKEMSESSQPRPAKRPAFPKSNQNEAPGSNPFSVLNGLPDEDEQMNSPKSSSPSTDILFDLNVTSGEPSTGTAHDNNQGRSKIASDNINGASASSFISTEQGAITQMLTEDEDLESMEEEDIVDAESEQMVKDAEPVSSPVSGRLWHGEAGNARAPEAVAPANQNASYLNTSTALSAQKQISKKQANTLKSQARKKGGIQSKKQ